MSGINQNPSIPFGATGCKLEQWRRRLCVIVDTLKVGERSKMGWVDENNVCSNILKHIDTSPRRNVMISSPDSLSRSSVCK